MLKIDPSSRRPVRDMKMNIEIAIVAGIVTAQVVTISPAICQRTLFSRSDAPDPIKAVLITCGVLTGIPRAEAARINIDDAACEARAFIGLIR